MIAILTMAIIHLEGVRDSLLSEDISYTCITFGKSIISLILNSGFINLFKLFLFLGVFQQYFFISAFAFMAAMSYEVWIQFDKYVSQRHVPMYREM